MKIAVVGGGVSGLVAAWLLSKQHEVTIFEAADYLGGHTNTVTIESGEDRGLAVDTGFIVLNNKTYPQLHKFLSALEVAVRFADMSFAFYDSVSRFAYAGTTLNGLFCQRRNLVSPSFYRFLAEIQSFSRKAQRLHQTGNLRDKTVGDLVMLTAASDKLVSQYLVPMAGAIWSASGQGILQFPAETLVSFFKNHGLLSLSDRPRWQTVVGGSKTYVEHFKERFKGTVLLNAAVEQIQRDEKGVMINASGHALQRFDKVVVALHADRALAALHNPSFDEQQLLGAWSYSRNETILHTDVEVLAPQRRAWASWNYISYPQSPADRPVAVSYHMNRLQGLKSKLDYIVTLNPQREIAPQKVIKSFNYEHPNFTLRAIKSQQRLQSLQGQHNSYFCGSYFGYGFHEDAVVSANAVAKLFGAEL